MLILNARQDPKAISPIDVTDVGMVTLFKWLPKKALRPIDVTDDGMLTLSNLKQQEKACGPIDLTEEGITTLFSDRLLLKAPCPIDVTDDGIDICDEEFRHEIRTPFSSISNPSIRRNLDSGDSESLISPHPSNGFASRYVTDGGMLTLFNEVQSLKTHLPINVTDGGITTLSKCLQSLKAKLQITSVPGLI